MHSSRKKNDIHIQMTTKAPKPQDALAAWSFAIPAVLAAAFCLFSVGYALFSSGFFTRASILFFCITALVPAAFFGYLLFGKGVVRWVVGGVGLLAFAFYLLQSWKDIFKGLNNLIVWTVGRINQYYLQDFVTIAPFGTSSERLNGELHLFFFLSVLFGFILVSSLSMKQGVIWSIMLLAPCFWIACNLCDTPQRIAILLLFMSFFAVFAICSSRYKRGRTGGGVEVGFHEGGFLGSADVMVYNSKGSGGSIFIWVNGLVLLIVAVAVLLYPKVTYSGTAPFEKIGQNPQEFVEDLRITGFPGFSIGQMGVNGGRLDSGSRYGTSYKTHLSLKSQTLVPMFLKGYTGALYKGTKWDKLEQEELLRLQSITKDYAALGITPQTTARAFLESISGGGKSADNILYPRHTLFSENIAANRSYTYLPYNNLTDYFTDSQWSEEEFSDEAIISGKNKGKSEFATQYMLVESASGKYSADLSSLYANVSLTLSDSNTAEVFAENYKLILQMMRDQYKDNIDSLGVKAEAEEQLFSEQFLDYEEFIFDNYLTLPKELVLLKAEAVRLRKSSTNPYAAVQEYLKEHAIYDFNPGAVPDGKDYVEYFLFENHRGYCTHFATAATLLFRGMGIPARYVEGYVMTVNDISDGAVGDDTSMMTADIPDSNAHSWVEVWMGMAGWQPVEVTPGFSENGVAPPSAGAPLPEAMQNATPLPEASADTSSDITAETSSEAVVDSEAENEEGEESSGTESDTKAKAEEFVPKRISDATMAFLYGFAGLIVFVILMRVGRIAAKLFRKRLERLDDTNRSTRCGYRFILAQVAILGCRIKRNETELQFAARLADTDEMPLRHGVEEAVSLATGAWYSNTRVSEADRDRVWEFANSLSEEMATSLPIIRRLIFMFLLWLG